MEPGSNIRPWVGLCSDYGPESASGDHGTGQTSQQRPGPVATASRRWAAHTCHRQDGTFRPQTAPPSGRTSRRGRGSAARTGHRATIRSVGLVLSGRTELARQGTLKLDVTVCGREIGGRVRRQGATQATVTDAGRNPAAHPLDDRGR